MTDSAHSLAVNTPEHTAAAAAVANVDELQQLRDDSILLKVLTAELIEHAELGHAAGVAQTAEQLLPMHVEFARVYRSWLARRVTGEMFVLGSGDGDRRST